MNPGIFVMGGGGGGGGGSGKGGSGSGGDQGADGEGGGEAANGGGEGAGACGPGNTAQCPRPHGSGISAGDPVDVATGRVFTVPAIDLMLPGPFPLVVERSYSSAIADRDVGLGPGWTHSYAWTIEERRRKVLVCRGNGTRIPFDRPKPGEVVGGPNATTLWHEGADLLFEAAGIIRRFSPRAEGSRFYRLQLELDAHGNRIELAYDGTRLAQITDAVGRIVRVAWSGDHIKSFSVTGDAQAGSHTFFRYEHDDRGDLVGVVDAAGNRTGFAYQDDEPMGPRRLTKHIHRDGLTFHYRYDDPGRCVETWGDHQDAARLGLADGLPQVLADGVTPARGIHHVRLAYLPDGYREVTDARGLHRFDVNELGALDLAVVGGGVYSFTMDRQGLLETFVDPLGHMSTWSRSEDGKSFAFTNPLSDTTVMERDDATNTVTLDSPTGYRLVRSLDAAGRLLSAHDDGGEIIRYEYDPRGLVLRATMPDGAVTEFAYDHHGNRTLVVEPDGSRKTITYDSIGRPRQVTDATGAVTSFHYDVRGGLTSVTASDGSAEHYDFDVGGRVARYVDEDGGVTAIEWGHLHRVLSVTKANGEVTAYRYDRGGRLMTVENGAGEVHRHHYDPGGRLVGESTFDGRRLRYGRDLNGALETFTRGDEGEVQLERDGTGAVVARVYPDDVRHDLDFDSDGRLLAATTPTTEVRRHYGARGQLVREEQVVDGETITVEFTHDALGRRVARTSSLGHHDVFERDAAGRLARIGLPDDDIRFSYSADGQVVDRHLAQGGVVRTTLDARLRVIGRDVTTAARLGAPTGQPQWVGDGPGDVETFRRFDYSGEGKLARVRDDAGETTFEYDGAGQVLTRARNGTVEESYLYTPAGYPAEAAGHGAARSYDAGGRLGSHGATAYRYDEAGRVVERREAGAATTYQWGEAGRLVAVQQPNGGEVRYRYDALGRRLLSEVVDEDGEVQRRTRFVYDGDDLLHEIVEGQDDTGSFRTVRTYVIGDVTHAPWASREVVQRGDVVETSPWTHYVNDAVGAPDQLISSKGQVLSQVEMTLWGKAPENAPTPLRFPGMVADPDTGLLYNRHRYLDPGTGRYISPDPLGFEGGFDSYRYADNAPNRYIDPDGLYAETVITDVDGNRYVGRSGSYGPREDLHPAVAAQLPGSVYNDTGNPIYPTGQSRRPGGCAEPDALSNYLRAYEDRHGVSLEPGTPGGRENLGVALSRIPNDGMATTWHGDNENNYTNGRAMAACPNCSAMMANMRDAYVGPQGEALRRRAPQPGQTARGRRGEEPTRRYEPPRETYRRAGGTGGVEGYR